MIRRARGVVRASTLLRSLALVVVVGLVLLFLSNTFSAYRDLQLAEAAYYFCVLAGLTVLAGSSGQVSLGHGAFMAVGAYTVAKLANAGWALAPELAAAVVATLIIGIPMGVACSRLRGPYLAGATLAFAVSAAAAGLGGGLLVVVTQLATPGAFPLQLSLTLLAGVVIGGLGSLWGAAWGAALLVLLPNWTNDVANSISLSTNVSHNLPIAVYGAVLIVAMLMWPSGIQGGVRALVGAVRPALAGRGGSAGRSSTERGGNAGDVPAGDREAGDRVPEAGTKTPSGS